MELFPEKLLRNHEDGEVVFFCGAGVSIPAGLPSFGKLVELTLKDLLPAKGQCEPYSMESLAWKMLKHKKYDEALGILESPQKGGFDVQNMRSKINGLLSIKKAKTPDKHLVLARLAGLDTADGRLVTTNFDHLFERAQVKLKDTKKRANQKLSVHVAPALPPAKPETFQGLAYLHGRLGSSVDDRHLVLTSADFGTAYMLEGWALRFVIDLFRHYHIVFVGYSLEDPTMRYLVQALAAARNEHFEQFKEPYALAPFGVATKKDESSVKQQWSFKGITPITYNDVNKHEQLWQALKNWGDMYSQGITGRRQLVTRLGRNPPVSDKNDSTVQDMAWALKNVDVARYSVNQVCGHRIHPGWIGPLQEQGLLNMPIGESSDTKPILVPLVSSRQLPDYFSLNEVTNHLGHWIAQSLDSRDALDWALIEGAVLHSQFREQVRQHLKKNSTDIPVALRTIWQILSDENYATTLSEKIGARYIRHASDLRLAPEDKLALRGFLRQLRPIPILKPKINLFGDQQQPNSDRPRDWCEIDIELVGFIREDDITEIRRIAKDWDGALAAIADEITMQLHEAMDWLSVFGLANSTKDITHIEYRSISPHDQNRYAHTWTQLIDLARESLDKLVARGNISAATRLLQKWRVTPYPIFRRLVLYAVTEHPALDLELGMTTLLNESQPALWGSQTLRETLRFLRKRGKDFESDQLDRLTEITLQGPPQKIYGNDFKEEYLNSLRDYQIFLRLSKLKESGVSLSITAEETYERMQQKRKWQLEGDNSEEFCIFISDQGYEHFESRQNKNFAEMSAEQFVQWANSQKGNSMLYKESDDGWSNFVANNTKEAVALLRIAMSMENWMPHVWRPVLQVCRTNDDTPEHLNQEIAKLLIDMPIHPLNDLALEAARWLEVVRQQLNKRLRLNLWQKIWEASYTDESPKDDLDLNMTLNHPGGILGNVLYRELTEYFPEVTPAQNAGFPRLLRLKFKCIAEGETPSAKLARVRLSPMIFVLFRIDPDWTNRTFFDRMNPTIVDDFDPFLWEGFFWFSRCPPDLLNAIKDLLFDILKDLDRLPDSIHRRAVELFTHFAASSVYGISVDKSKEVLWRFGPNKLIYVARVLNVMLRDAEVKSPLLWKETLQPWFTNVWPKRPVDKSLGVSESLARMAIESGDAFPDIVNEIADKLTDQNCREVFYLLNKYEQDANLISKFPEASLTLIDKICHEDCDIFFGLDKVLDAIGKSRPSLKETEPYKRLASKL